MRTGELYQRYYGVYLASVRSVDDPSGLGRIRVECDQFSDAADNVVWATVVRPVAGDNTVFFTPKVGDQVIIAYLVGDVNEPVVMGYAHSTKQGQQPPKRKQRKQEAVPPPDEQIVDTKRHGIITDRFHIELNENDDSPRLRLTNRVNGDYVELDANDNTISVQATTALNLKAVGVVDIEGAVVRINGRLVLSTPKPI